MNNYADQSLGALAISIPGATRLFRTYDLDFCCGGKQTLRKAAENKNLDMHALVNDLAALTSAKSETKQDWQIAPLEIMTHHMVSAYHELHRKQLPELIYMAEKVERVHADKADCPRGVTHLLKEIYMDLNQHMMKEEEILFPLIESGMGQQAQGPIMVMESEHDEAGNQLEDLKKLTSNMNAPEAACNTWRALYAGIDQFVLDLMEHIHLENNILFPRALQGA